jgi:hypothetical protein
MDFVFLKKKKNKEKKKEEERKERIDPPLFRIDPYVTKIRF